MPGKRVQQVGLLDRIEFRQEDLTNLSFPDSSFRSVFSWGGIIHIPEAEKSLDELARILQPGGRLALYLTNRAALDHKIESHTRFLVNKPLEGMYRARMGDGIFYGSDEERLWVWRFDADALGEHLARRGLFLVRRHIGELSHIQRLLRGLPRKSLLHLNNFAYRLGVPPCLGTCNLYIFEKGSSG